MDLMIMTQFESWDQTVVCTVQIKTKVTNKTNNKRN